MPEDVGVRLALLEDQGARLIRLGESHDEKLFKVISEQSATRNDVDTLKKLVYGLIGAVLLAVVAAVMKAVLI